MSKNEFITGLPQGYYEETKKVIDSANDLSEFDKRMHEHVQESKNVNRDSVIETPPRRRYEVAKVLGGTALGVAVALFAVYAAARVGYYVQDLFGNDKEDVLSGAKPVITEHVSPNTDSAFTKAEHDAMLANQQIAFNDWLDKGGQTINEGEVVDDTTAETK
jgi:hypothetical protein